MSSSRRRIARLLGLALLAVLLHVPSPAIADSSGQHSNTQLTVMSFVTLSGVPAVIDFGAGSPGVLAGGQGGEAPAEGVTAPSFIAIVRTNDSAGYVLRCLTSDLASQGPDMVIDAQQVAYQVTPMGLGTGDGGTVADAGSPLTLAHSDQHSIAAGDGYAITPSLIIPFVPTGVYQGTATFEATGL